MLYTAPVNRFQVDRMMLTPPYVVLLGKSDIDPDLDLSCVKTLYVGGAPMKKAMLATVQKKLGKHVQVRQRKLIKQTCVHNHSNPHIPITSTLF
jgi:non-ribosomal peptide synthetase component E (peptide arylation enzyme)